MGMKPSYNKDIHPKLAKRLIGLDYTQEQAAQHMCISVETFILWKKKYPEFLNAVERGKYEPVKKVTGSLYKRANGYDYEEEVYEVIYPEENKGKKGSKGKALGRKKKPIKRLVRTIKKHVPGDVGALKFVLTNKDKKQWQESSKIELGGQMEYIVKPPIVPIIKQATKKEKSK